MSTLALTFNGVSLTPISHNNQIWLTSSELAKALGYAREDSVSRIYDRNKDEFNDSMTILRDRQIDVLGESSGLQNIQRIFSLRGCHLIAMFAKTAIAKQFRVWVLDILDKAAGEPKPYGLRDSFTCPYANQTQSAPVVTRSIELITREQLDKIENMVRQIEICCRFEGKAKWHIYASLREMFAIEKIADLPSSQFNAAYGHLAVMHEMAKQHLKLLCEADKKFIESVLRKGRFQLQPQQYGLLA